eukprot:COSAG04_NODE_13060_length_622_cov_0.699809_1_plen_158_part_10
MTLLLVATMLAAACHGAGSAIEHSVVFDPGRSTAPWPGQPEGVSAGGCFAAPSLLHIPREPAGNPNGTLLLLAVATQPAPARHPANVCYSQAPQNVALRRSTTAGASWSPIEFLGELPRTAASPFDFPTVGNATDFSYSAFTAGAFNYDRQRKVVIAY